MIKNIQALVAMQGAAIQENILQSYRRININVTIILTAIGVAVGVFTIISESINLKFLLLSMVAALALATIMFNKKMTSVVYIRADNVDYWHGLIIKSESKLRPAQRLFTLFKIKQKHPTMDEKVLLKNIYHTMNDNASVKNLLGEKAVSSRDITEKFFNTMISATWLILIITVAVSLAI